MEGDLKSSGKKRKNFLSKGTNEPLFSNLLKHSIFLNSRVLALSLLINFQQNFTELQNLFAIIQSTCYRLIKGQQYLKNMYEINFGDFLI